MKLIEELYTCDLSATDRPAWYREECRDIERCTRERSELDERCAFLLGFRSAVRLMTESFSDDA